MLLTNFSAYSVCLEINWVKADGVTVISTVTTPRLRHYVDPCPVACHLQFAGLLGQRTRRSR